MRWVPPLGVLGAAIGAIAIGTAATSTSITTIISIETTIRTSIGVKLARATTGSTIRNTAEMLLMVTGKRRISSAPMLASSLGAELPIARAAEPELETGPVAALELVLVQVAVALRTKSATAAHPHDLVPAPRVEDLAAAAETTREPAAAEAAVAWEAAE